LQQADEHGLRPVIGVVTGGDDGGTAGLRCLP